MKLHRPDFSSLYRQAPMNASLSMRLAGNMRQRGYVLVVSMVLLLVITLVSISMAKSYFLEEGMSANVRDKNRAFMAAQAALAFGQFIAISGANNAVPCIGYSGASTTTPYPVCTQPAVLTQNPTLGTAPLKFYIQASLPPSLFNTNGFVGGIVPGTTSNTSSENYFAPPGVYVYQWPTQGYFTITAFGYGSSANSLTIVQATFTTRQCQTGPESVVTPC